MRLMVHAFLRKLPVLSLCCLASALVFLTPDASAQGAAQRVPFETRTAPAAAIDTGAIPSSQRLSLTLTLASDPARKAALDQYLAALTTPSSPSYHQWLTPAQFAASYGATPDQIATATAWLQAQGMTVDAVSPSATRITASGFASQIEPAFAVSLHHYSFNGNQYFAATSKALLPAAIAPSVAAVDGLDSFPGTSLPPVAAIVDANNTPILPLQMSVDPAASGAYESLFRQAAAQGITTILTGSFGSPEATVLATADGTDTPFAARPSWQNSPGLPADTLRHTPDLTPTSLTAFTQTITSIALQNSGRLGNINATLYALAPTAGLYTQPDAAAAGTWEPASGLGLVDLAQLAKVYPRGTGTNTLQIATSASAPVHGNAFTLTVTDSSTNGGVIPTGTVTFTAMQSAFPGSTVTLNGGGVALSPSYLLPGDTYNISAAYSGDANYAPATASITLTVQPEPAVFTITAPASVSLGSTITATVTLSSASGVGTPKASVTVTPSGITGASAITQSVTGSNGTASAQYTFTTRQAGSVSLQASCTSSDGSFTCYTPQTSTTTVPQATPTVALTLTPSNPTAGQQITFAAAVTGVAGIGTTGSVQFFDGSTSLGFGSAPADTYAGTLAPGSNHTITAVYQGDSNYLKATSNTVTPTVGLSSTTTSVNPSASSAAYGQNITLNVTVATSTTVNGTLPTGTLTFTGLGNITSATVSGGSANVVLSSLPAGTYTIGTSYSGDANYSGSTATNVVITVTQAAATLSSQLSSTGFTTGSSSTLTVTVQLPGNAQLPTGSTFLATIVGVTGAAYTGTFAINPGGNTGTGQATILAPIAGTYSLTITCGISANYTCTPETLPITSTASTGSVPVSSTGLTASLTPISALPGATSTITATVTAPSGTVPTGTITAVISNAGGTVATYTGALPGTAGTTVGTITIPVTVPTVIGTYTVAVSCTNSNVTCTTVDLTLVSSATPGLIPTTTNLTAAPSTLTSGSTVLTATVTSTLAGSALITGTVTFFDGTTQIGMAALGATPTAAVTVILSTTATHSITAVYSGDTNFATSTSAINNGTTTLIVPTITLSSNVASGVAGGTVVFSATISGLTTATTSYPAVGPTGTVSFYIGGVTSLIGTATLGTTAPGVAVATFSASNLPSGALTIYAVYNGDANFSKVTSTSITLGLSDFALSFVPTTLTVADGTSGSVTAVVTPINGFAGTIVLSCATPSSSNMTCGFNPTTFVGGGGTSTFTVKTTLVRSATLEPPAHITRTLLGGTAFAALLCLFLPSRRRRLPMMLLFLLALGLSMNLGCAANDFGSTPSTGLLNTSTPLGTTILTINTVGTSGTNSVRHNYNFQVTVQ